MARWNLRRAADAAPTGALDDGRAPALARARRRARRRLRPRHRTLRAVRRVLRARAARDRRHRCAAAGAADLLLGAARTHAAQVVKQADVLMLHYLVPGRGRRRLARPEPRLLRAAHRARQLALAGRPRRAARPARPARAGARAPAPHRPDRSRRHRPDDAPAACTWRRWAASGTRSRFGFAGLRPAGDALAIDPVAVPGVDALDLRVRFRGSRVRLRITPTTPRSAPPRRSAWWHPAATAVEVGPDSPHASTCRRRPRASVRHEPRPGSHRHEPVRARGPRDRAIGRRAVRGHGSSPCTCARTASTPPSTVARHADVEFREAQGSPIEAIAAAAADPDVVVVVLGARGVHGGPRPAGRTALEVVTRVSKPVVVVPPDGTTRRRGSRASSRRSKGRTRARRRSPPRSRWLVAAMSRSSSSTSTPPDEIPAFQDQPQHAIPAWEHEFAARFVVRRDTPAWR